MITTITNTEHLWLEITEEQLQTSWDYSQKINNPLSRQQVYLNHLCLNVFLPWLSAEVVEHSFAPPLQPNQTTLKTIWSLVDGTAIEINHKRLVLIPTDDWDTEELRVPQEWVDIPSWTAHYYLAVQIDTEEGWLRVWGYTTHQQLKTTANYISQDRTYSIAEADLKEKLNLLLIEEEFFPEKATLGFVAPLPRIDASVAHNLIERLGNPEVVFPRRSVPFTTWGALLEHAGWRKNLYRLREGLSPSLSVQQWLREGIDELSQQLGWRNLRLETGLSRSSEAAQTEVYLSRQLTIAGQNYELKVIPKDMAANVWRFELQSLELGGSIPGGFKLRLLTEELEEFIDNEDVARETVERLEVEVELEPSEGLVWETQPLPDNYEREILRF